MNLAQTFSGGIEYRSDLMYEQYLLFVALPCIIGDRPIDALLDTGSQWCMLPAGIAEELGYGVQSEALWKLSSQLALA